MLIKTRKNFLFFFYLFANYNTITNYILIIHKLNNSSGYRTHDLRANCLAHYQLDYQGIHSIELFELKFEFDLLKYAQYLFEN